MTVADTRRTQRIAFLLVLPVCLVLAFMPTARARGASPSLAPTDRETSREAERREIAQEAERYARLLEERKAADDAFWRDMATRALCFAGTSTAYGVLQNLYEEFRKVSPNVPAELYYRGGGTEIGFRQLLAGHVEAALVRRQLNNTERSQLKQVFSNPDEQPEERKFGKAAMIVVVHKGNVVPSLSVQQVEDIYRERITDWAKVGDRPGKIGRLGTLVPALSDGMFHELVLQGKRLPYPDEGHPDRLHTTMLPPEKPRQRFPGNRNYLCFKTDRELMEAVAKDRSAIGYCLLPVNGALPKGVRSVPIVPASQTTPVSPTRESVLLDEYPLQYTISFLIKPRSSGAAREFVEFACGTAASPLVRQAGLLSLGEKEEILAAQRLAEMKAGKGARIQAAGSVRGPLMQDLAVEYVRAKAVVQMQYAVADESAAVGQFLGGKELLLLQGPPSEAILKVHGAGWTALGAEPHAVAGRAVAIVTSIVNKEEAMTLDRVRSIFSGEVGQWGDSLVMAQKDIHCYGLGAPDPLAAMFHSGVMRGTRCKNLQVKKDTPEIVAALALDPQGIAFVDLARIPQDSTAVRVVAIGSGDKVVKPNGRTVAEGTYPLSQRLFLYVSPQASETAKEFVRFILSGACEQTFRQHGFVSASQPPPAP